jgi:hypothetical protein
LCACRRFAFHRWAGRCRVRPAVGRQRGEEGNFLRGRLGLDAGEAFAVVVAEGGQGGQTTCPGCGRDVKRAEQRCEFLAESALDEAAQRVRRTEDHVGGLHVGTPERLQKVFCDSSWPSRAGQVTKPGQVSQLLPATQRGEPVDGQEAQIVSAYEARRLD